MNHADQFRKEIETSFEGLKDSHKVEVLLAYIAYRAKLDTTCIGSDCPQGLMEWYGMNR